MRLLTGICGWCGNTVTIRKPATFEAQEFDRSSGIQIQDATGVLIQ